MLVISKPPGLPVHRNEGVRRHTVADYAQRDFGLLPTIQGAERPGIIHRLDKETSGVMVLGRTPEAFHHIRDQFRKRTVSKEYMAVIAWGDALRFRVDREADRARSAAADADVGSPRGGSRAPPSSRRSSDSAGTPSRAASPRLGEPTKSESTYRRRGIRSWATRSTKPNDGSRSCRRTRRPLLANYCTAQALEFTHPVTGKRVRFVDEPPEDFEAFIGYLRRKHSAKD